MKQAKLFFFFLLIISNVVFSQEIEHPHSIHHAFIENKGQWDKDVLFKSRFQGGNLWIQQNKFLFHLQDYSVMEEAHAHPKDNLNNVTCKQTVVHLNFVGSNQVSEITKVNPTKTYYNYFLGNKREEWVSDVRGYSEANLENLYNGIDLKLIEKQEELKYEFHAKSQANPADILLEYVGQKEIRIDEKGNLIIVTDLGKIIEQKPYSYQIINGKIIEVPCSFILVQNKVAFQLGTYNSNVELIIDPVLIFATYSGSITDNFGMTATYAHDGKAYSGGTVYGNSYPTPAAAYNTTSNFTVPDGTTYGITDVFISKYSSDGTSMIWTSFIGGGDDTQGTETVHSLITDLSDNIYLYGATSSFDFPIQNGYQTTHGGGTPNSNFYFNGVYYSDQGTDIYVAKLSSDGLNLMGSTYMGGSSNDGVNFKISSGIYNTVAAYDSLTSNYGDTFRGEIMLDSVGNCMVASCSRSTDFPVLNAFQPSNAGAQDGVLFKLSSDLSSLQWSSYFGGTNNDACYSVKIDSSYNVVFAGGTSSNNLPNTVGKWQSTYNGGKTDGFVGKLTSDGLVLSGVTYVGTSNYDQVFFVEIDRNDNVFLLGQSTGGAFPVTNSSFVNPSSSQFICKLNSSLTSVLNSTVFGNGGASINISPSAFLVDICGNMYVSGWGANILQSIPLSGMPTSSDAFQSTPPNGFDFYLMVLDRTFSSLLYGTYLGGNQANEHVDGGSSRFDKNGVVYQSVCGGCGGYSDFPTTAGAWSNNNLSSNCNNIIFKFDFGIIPKAEFITADNLGCADFVVHFDNSSPTSDSYLWDFGNGDTSSIILDPTITYDSAGIYEVFLYVTDSICLLTDTAQIIITVTEQTQLTVSPDVELCFPSVQILTANSFGTANSFIWSSNISFFDTLNVTVADSTLTVSITENTTYYVMANNDGGCPKIDSVYIEVISSNFILSGDTKLCSSDSSSITATNFSTSPFNYNWTPDSIIVAPSFSNTVLVNPKESQYIYMLADNSLGCSYKDSIWIDVSNIDSLMLINEVTDTICLPTSITLEANTFGTGDYFIWSTSSDFLDTLNSSTLDSTFTSTISTTGYFYVKSGNFACSTTDSVYIEVISSNVILSGDTKLCAGDSSLITATNSSTFPFTYSWIPDSIIVVPSFSNTVLVNPKESQYVFLLVDNLSGCSFEDSIWIDVSNINSVMLITEITDTICKPTILTLEANSFGTGDYFIWSSSYDFMDTLNSSVLDSTYTSTISNSDYFYIKGGNDACYKIDSIYIMVFNSNISLTGDHTLCIGESSLITATNSSTFPFYNSWSPDSVTVMTSDTNVIIVNPKTSQYIYMLADNLLGCSFLDSIWIDVSDIDSLSIVAKASDIDVPEGGTVILSVLPNGYSYQWNPTDGISNPNAQITSAVVEKTTLFKVNITDGICTKSDSVLVKTFPFICDDPSIFIPNAFSPNGDGQNDVLFVRGKMIKNMTFKVFDRWGELVFESNERGIGWDGTYKGKKMDPDVYDYYLKVTCIDNIESIVKGNVTLLK